MKMICLYSYYESALRRNRSVLSSMTSGCNKPVWCLTHRSPERSDKSSDWLSSANAARDRKHSPSISDNYSSLHAGCQLANSSVIIPLLPVESGWQRAQYQSHGITLLLAFISPALSFTVKDSGFCFTLKTNVSACSARPLLRNTRRRYRKL